MSKQFWIAAAGLLVFNSVVYWLFIMPLIETPGVITAWLIYCPISGFVVGTIAQLMKGNSK